MKIQRSSIIVALILVILLAFVVLGFFWIEETVPQDSVIKEDESITIDDQEQSIEPQLYLTVMTHMEHSFLDDKNENIFLEHVEALRYAMDLADEVGAVLSIESEQPFALACAKWGLNFMQEVLDRGHGVETHCDLGSSYTRIKMSPVQYSEAFKENKDLVDALVGAENNIGCSGGPGVNDWAIAASIAGFKFINGIVGGHLLAIPYENRPGEIWTDEYLNTDGWHAELPENPYERIYPIPFADAQDFIADENPIIIAMPGTIGALYNASESENDPCLKNGDCEFTKEDVDANIETIMDIADHYDPERGVAKITIYIAVDLYDKENEEILKYLFSEIGKLEDSGIVKFGTHQEIYEAYIEQTGFEL